MTSNPCKDMFSEFLFLHFKSEALAKTYSDQLWDTASISSSPNKCHACSYFHLLDVNGLRLLSSEEKIYKYDSTTKKRIPLKRCQSCLSSTGIPKAIFTNLEEAQRDLEHLGFEVKHPMYAYRCPHGMGIHLTKQEPTKTSRYLGIILQNKLAKTLRDRNKSATLNTEKVNVENIVATKAEPKKDLPIPVSKAENSLPPKFHCLSCGYKNNYDSELKCAWCNELGPYERI